ncbi:hypothetical protein QJS10_CPA01g01000 [Acorus calamus]|uniref:Uncharacterized protein n=1 Tax=Acorus calamus TaxID=4465 RepID=A0AAV9FN13_ACOCL|nr:hypothetical protein QJS10_CPA01g01000 [Acorus calamus]
MFEVVDAMLDIVVPPLLTEASTLQGMHTPLHEAVIGGHEEVVALIIEKRKDMIAIKDATGCTALHYAAQKDNGWMVDMLLTHDPSLAYTPNFEGSPPLHIAAAFNSKSAITELLKWCPDAAEQLSEGKMTALHVAVIHGSLRALTTLLKMIDLEEIVNKGDKDMNTPLHVAAKNSRIRSMMVLLEDRRIDVRLINKDGETARDIIESHEEIDPYQLSLRNDYRPSEPLYTAILSRLRDPPSIDSLLLRARRERFPLSDPFFHKLIKTQSPDRALHTLSRMPSDFHCFPSVKTFNLVLAALVSVRRYDSVRALLCALVPRLGVTPDTCSRDDALALLDEMPKPNRVTYSTLMHFLCARGEVGEAFVLLERMERKRCEPDTVVFNVLISGVVKRGRVDEAMGMLRGMMRWGCRLNSDSYQAVLCGLIGARRFGEAKVFVVEKMGRERGRRPSFKAYEAVVAGLCGEGRVGDAEVVLRCATGSCPGGGLGR